MLLWALTSSENSRAASAKGGGGCLGLHCSPPSLGPLSKPHSRLLGHQFMSTQAEQRPGSSEGPAEPAVACRGQPCSLPLRGCRRTLVPSLGRPGSLDRFCFCTAVGSPYNVEQKQPPPLLLLLLELSSCGSEVCGGQKM